MNNETMVEIDWTLYDSFDREPSKKSFEDLIIKIQEFGGILKTKYTTNTSIIEIQFDDALLATTADSYKNSIYKSLKRTKEVLDVYGDKLIGFSGVTERNVLVAKIETYDNGYLELDVNNITQFIRARNKYVNFFKECGAVALTAYLGNEELMRIQFDKAIIEVTPKNFRNQTIKKFEKFKTQLEDNDVCLELLDYGANGFKVKIKSTDIFHNEGTFIVTSGRYKEFCKGRKLFYEYIIENSYKSLSIYKGNSEIVLVDFKCGHKPKETKPNILKQDVGCLQCYLENNTGENHPMWKGGISALNIYLRTHLLQWKRDSLRAYNYKCMFTGTKGKELVIHHLYSFTTLMTETLEELNIQLKDTVVEYTDEELELIKNRCIEKHYETGLGVVITKTIHKEFHSIYGYGDNTPEQFEEFKQIKLNQKK